MTQSSENGGWDPDKYPPTLLNAMATRTLLNIFACDPETTFSLSVVSGNVVIALKANLGRQVALVTVGPAEYPAQRMIEFWEQLIDDWNNLATEFDRSATCGVLQSNERFKKAFAFLEELKIVQGLPTGIH